MRVSKDNGTQGECRSNHKKVVQKQTNPTTAICSHMHEFIYSRTTERTRKCLQLALAVTNLAEQRIKTTLSFKTQQDEGTKLSHQILKYFIYIIIYTYRHAFRLYGD